MNSLAVFSHEDRRYRCLDYDELLLVASGSRPGTFVRVGGFHHNAIFLASLDDVPETEIANS
jgi:hypothetical protein